MPIWDPWRDLWQMEREMGRLFEEFWGRGRGGTTPAITGRTGAVPVENERLVVGTPPVDLIDKKDSIVLRSEIPGVKKKDIKITVTDDGISLSGKVEQKKEEKEENYYHCERVYSSWARTVPLPVGVESDKAKAVYREGVLEITLPKSKEAKERRREIKIE